MNNNMQPNNVPANNVQTVGYPTKNTPINQKYSQGYPQQNMNFNNMSSVPQQPKGNNKKNRDYFISIFFCAALLFSLTIFVISTCTSF